LPFGFGQIFIEADPRSNAMVITLAGIRGEVILLVFGLFVEMEVARLHLLEASLHWEDSGMFSASKIDVAG
jgi:hypothetical protein